MQDFVKTYTGRSATTEDFKATIEKHMTDARWRIGNGNRNGLVLQRVRLRNGLARLQVRASSFDTDATATVVLNLKLRQSGVR